MFSSIHRLTFHCPHNVLGCTKVFNFDKVQLTYFSFCCLCLGVSPKNSLQKQTNKKEFIAKSKVIKIYLQFSAQNFMVLAVIFRSLAHF